MTFPPIRVNTEPGRRAFRRADIVFEEVEQAGPSFEGRVFLNNPSADETTERTPENGYAGSFHVYGYGMWPPDQGGKDAPAADQSVPRAPIAKQVMATEAARAALSQGDEVTVTVVAIPDPGADADLGRVSIRVNGPPDEGPGVA